MAKMRSRRQWQRYLICSLGIGFGLAIASCRSDPTPTSSDPQAVQEQVEEGLVLENATLEQSDDKGRVLWKINAKTATYSRNRKLVKMENIKGDLYQDGKVVMQVTGKLGDIEEDGQIIRLHQDIVAIDPRNQAILKGQELEWRPQEDVAILSDNVSGTNDNFEVKAQEGRYYSRTQQMQLKGNVAGIAKEPPVQMKTEAVTWDIENKTVKSDVKVAIDRYEDKTVTDRVVADKGEVNLASKIVTLTQNVELKATEPPLQIASNQAIWNVEERSLRSPQPIQVVHLAEKFTVTGNQGFIDLENQIARFEGGIRGISTKQQANLTAESLVWEIPKQLLNAKGNVAYSQSDPPLELTGQQATAKLEAQSVKIASGDRPGRVTTHITPR
ncbi:MAG: LPS export ABC transporter periplasmic protein LptC [Jaaginema sp. PMC 1079.18]|nr:LPS export ABC transporter periplasmic protein LptC [Jaaginema sp. PMC 1080.18]MEC4850740.1 LPS export ABC transporter periplasmic protein LptC [Jaaginema sp. PMC 1079.18]